MIEPILEPLLTRHDLPQLTQALADEQCARETFRQQLTPSQKAEFIAGEVVVHLPAKAKHLLATGRLHSMLQLFVARHQLGQVFSEKALIALMRNDYEPDIVFFSADKSNAFEQDQMTFPAPDFIVEVLSDSTERHHRVTKFNDYALHQVGEYWIVDCDQRSIEQYVLPADVSIDDAPQYQLLQKLTQGHTESQIIDGFRIPTAAIFDDAEQASAMLDLLSG